MKKRMILFLTGFLFLIGCGKEIENFDNIKASISDFEYDFDSQTGDFKITEYNGGEKILYIQSEYMLAKEMRKPDLSEFQIGVGDSNVEFLILEDGISNIGASTFNSCDVKYIYFPKTMELIYDYTLSYLHPEEGEKISIYYGGTEDEWNKIITKYEPQSITDVWNSDKPTEEKAGDLGTALADKLNDWMGAEYKSSDFEFHYSVSIDDLIDIINNNQ